MTKKIISTVLALTMMVSMSISVFAAESGTVGPTDGDVITEKKSIDQQLSEYLARTDKTPEAKQAALQKAELAKSLTNGTNILSHASRATSKNLSMTFYSQSNSYYCGPATTQQTLKYLNGSSPSQSTLATELGTTSSSGTDTNNISDYLNNNTDKSYSVLWWWADASALSDMVITDVDAGTPIVAHVIISTKSEWPYTTTGHYMNYNGYSSSGSSINVTDPWADRYDKPTGKYSVSNTAAESVTDRIVW